MNHLKRRKFITNSMTLAGTLSLPGIYCTRQSVVPSYLKGYERLYSGDPHKAAMQWFKDAKFGLFVHYALASLFPRGKVSYLEILKSRNFDRDKSDYKKEKGYKDFQQETMKKFTAEKFNADMIADLAVQAGMKYINFTTRHLLRLFMYKTSISDFTSVNSPAGRDLVGELAEACARRNLGLFLYVPPETMWTDNEHRKQNRVILRELLTQYGPIAGIWFDGISYFWKTPEKFKYLQETYDFVRSLQPQALISFKEGALGTEDFVSPEHFLLPKPVKWNTPGRQERWQIRLDRWQIWNKARNGLWEKIYKKLYAEINTTMQECNNRDGIGAAGGWINDEEARHLTPDEVIYFLKIARSFNSNLLLNIGPRGDGSIHPDDKKTLIEVGNRIKKNGFPGGKF